MLARGSRLMLGLFLAGLVVEHWLQPGLDPDRHRISEYANGSPGWLMTAGFTAWGLSLTLAALALWHSGLRPSGMRVGVSVLLAIAAAGALVTAALPTGTSGGIVPPGHHLSEANHLHDLGSGVLAVVLWCCVVGSLAFRTGRLRTWSAGVLAVGLAGALVLNTAGLPGIEQRLLVVLACLWQYTFIQAISGPEVRGASRARPRRQR
jgi:hypothetical protein